MRVVSSLEDLQSAAQGRWGTILPAVGVDPGVLSGKPQPCPCPGCGAQKDGFRYDDQNGRGDWVCNGKGVLHYGDGIDLIREIQGCSYAEAIRQVCQVIGWVWAGKGTVPGNLKDYVSFRSLANARWLAYVNGLPNRGEPNGERSDDDDFGQDG